MPQKDVRPRYVELGSVARMVLTSQRQLDAARQSAHRTPNGIHQGYGSKQQQRLRSDPIIGTEIVEDEIYAAKNQDGNNDPEYRVTASPSPMRAKDALLFFGQPF